MTSVARPPEELPDFDAPPVAEIVGSIQFNALPRLTLQDMIAVGGQLSEYDLVELQPPLPPIQELPPGAPALPALPQIFLGQQSQRALYRRQDQRFVAQLQGDRIAINERRVTPDIDPSSLHVWPELDWLARVVRELLVHGEGFGPASANFVELTYVNAIADASIDQVLRIVSADAGEPPYTPAENPVVRFSFPVVEGKRFCGRLHIEAGAGIYEDEPVTQLQLISRRIVEKAVSVADVFDACHREAVRAFVAVTEPAMHRIWRRTR